MKRCADTQCLLLLLFIQMKIVGWPVGKGLGGWRVIQTVDGQGHCYLYNSKIHDLQGEGGVKPLAMF